MLALSLLTLSLSIACFDRSDADRHWAEYTARQEQRWAQESAALQQRRRDEDIRAAADAAREAQSHAQNLALLAQSSVEKEQAQQAASAAYWAREALLDATRK